MVALVQYGSLVMSGCLRSTNRVLSDAMAQRKWFSQIQWLHSVMGCSPSWVALTIPGTLTHRRLTLPNLGTLAFAGYSTDLVLSMDQGYTQTLLVHSDARVTLFALVLSLPLVIA